MFAKYLDASDVKAQAAAGLPAPVGVRHRSGSCAIVFVQLIHAYIICCIYNISHICTYL